MGNVTDTPLGILRANLAEFQSMSDAEESHFSGLARQVAPAVVVRVPFLADDVHDLAGLEVISGHLVA
jgi:hypothetical protein